MDTTSVLNLLIALCRYLEVPVEELASFFGEQDHNQEYYNRLADLYAHSPPAGRVK